MKTEEVREEMPLSRIYALAVWWGSSRKNNPGTTTPPIMVSSSTTNPVKSLDCAYRLRQPTARPSHQHLQCQAEVQRPGTYILRLTHLENNFCSDRNPAVGGNINYNWKSYTPPLRSAKKSNTVPNLDCTKPTSYLDAYYSYLKRRQKVVHPLLGT